MGGVGVFGFCPPRVVQPSRAWFGVEGLASRLETIHEIAKDTRTTNRDGNLNPKPQTLRPKTLNLHPKPKTPSLTPPHMQKVSSILDSRPGSFAMPPECAW